MLRKLDEPELAARIESDIRAGRATVGDAGGANATTGVGVMDRSVILRPIAGATGLGTGTTDNTMTISDKILTDIRTTPGADKSAANVTNVVGWALTLRHEYEHVGQRDPRSIPRDEDPAYRETIKSGVSWYRSTKAELEEVLAGPASKERLDRARELRMRLDALADQTNGIFNDMPERIREGNVSGNLVVTTLDGTRVTGPTEAQNRNWGIIARDRTTLNEATRKFETAVDELNAPVSGTGVARVGGTSGSTGGNAKPKQSIFDKINNVLTKADQVLADANKKASGAQQTAAGASGASGASGPAVSANSSAVPAGGTSLTLELPGFWGHLNYTISGAQLDPPSGGDRGKVAGRSYTGKLAGNTLVISGTAISDNESSGPGSGDYYEVTVEVNVGQEHGYFGYIAQKGEKLNKPFNVRVPIPADAKSGTFSISLLEQNKNWGTYGWVVTGTLSR